MARHAEQKPLFDTGASLPNGLVYKPEFLTPKEEQDLLDAFSALSFFHPTTEGYAAKRRIANFGWSYDFEKEKLIPGPDLPAFLAVTQRKIAKWLDISKKRVAQALITEYEPGTSLGWHRDNEKFESVIGISLAGWARIRFRPLPLAKYSPKDMISLELEPRSAYIMQKEVRWDYQHSVDKTRGLRYSITFRTLPA